MRVRPVPRRGRQWSFQDSRHVRAQLGAAALMDAPGEEVLQMSTPPAANTALAGIREVSLATGTARRRRRFCRCRGRSVRL
jgi:hypothetical protein